MKTAVNLCFALLLIPSLGGAQEPVPFGPRMQVNTYTTMNQIGASVAPAGPGHFVVVWTSDGSSGTDVHYNSVQAQRFTWQGWPVGAEFQVNDYTLNDQRGPSVGSDGSNGYVIVWVSEGSSGSDSSQTSIQGQRFDSDGNASGGEFQVNSFTTGNQISPVVGPDGSGGFIVVWDQGSLLSGQRYASDGAPVAGEFQINSPTTGGQYSPAISPDGSGGFVVAWTSLDSPTYNVKARIFSSDGQPVAPDFIVNTLSVAYLDGPSVSRNNGDGFVVVWQSYQSAGSDTGAYSIQGRRFGTDGSAIGDQFQVNTYTTAWQVYPEVVAYGTDGFAVVWQTDGELGVYNKTGVQRFGSDGALIGEELGITPRASGLALGPNEGGGFLLIGHSSTSEGSDDSGQSVQALRFASPIFADGFESGDFTLWSNSVP